MGASVPDYDGWEGSDTDATSWREEGLDSGTGEIQESCEHVRACDVQRKNVAP
jgi:hypothetical protein